MGSASCALRTPGGLARNCETAAKDWLEKGMCVLGILKHCGLTVSKEGKKKGRDTCLYQSDRDDLLLCPFRDEFSCTCVAAPL